MATEGGHNNAANRDCSAITLARNVFARLLRLAHLSE
jgi:hypothetical protein